MRNYISIDNDGSLELRLGPLYFVSLSKLDSFGFCDIYLDLGRRGLFRVGLASGPSGSFVFKKLNVL